MAVDEINLRSLGDKDLVEQMHADLYDGLKDEIEEGVRILLGRDWSPYRTLTEALVRACTSSIWRSRAPPISPSA